MTSGEAATVYRLVVSAKFPSLWPLVFSSTPRLLFAVLTALFTSVQSQEILEMTMRKFPYEKVMCRRSITEDLFQFTLPDVKLG